MPSRALKVLAEPLRDESFRVEPGLAPDQIDHVLHASGLAAVGHVELVEHAVEHVGSDLRGHVLVEVRALHASSVR